MKNFKDKVSKHFSQKTNLGEMLMKISKLTLPEVAEAADKGAVWLQKNGQGKILRARSPELVLSPNDIVSLFYDKRVLNLPYFESATCLFESKHYGIWLKPAGIVPQGTQAGDHTSLLRFVEKKKNQEVYLIHRLDRETQGLMMVGYTSQAAALLSELFQKNKVHKLYEAVVLGTLTPGKKDSITASLDGKEAITHFEVLDSNERHSLLQLNIETGRLHQIRRHLDFIGHPVIGDPKYGQGNKNRQGFKLLARSLSFIDPWTKKTVQWTLESGLSL